MSFNRIIPKSNLEPFLPTLAQQIQDGDAMAFLNHLQRQPIMVSDLVTGAPPVTVPTAVMATGKPTPADSAPLILLPGFDSSALEFRHLIPYLAPYKATYALDVLGFGFTASPPSAPSPPARFASTFMPLGSSSLTVRSYCWGLRWAGRSPLILR